MIDLVGELGDDAADYRIQETITKVSGPIVGNGGEAAKGWVRVPRGSAPWMDTLSPFRKMMQYGVLIDS